MKTGIILVVIILLAIISFIVFKPGEKPAEENNSQTPDNEQVREDTTFEPVILEDGVYSVNTEESKIKWTGRKKVLTNWIDTGTIKIQSGNLTISDKEISSSELVIDMTSIEAKTTGSGGGQDSLSTHLKSEDFFDVENYPTSNLTIKKIDPVKTPGKFNVYADLTIKGITNEIIIPVDAEKLDSKYKAVGSINIDRTLWDIRFGSNKFFDNLGDNVIDDIINIEFELTAEKNE